MSFWDKVWSWFWGLVNEPIGIPGVITPTYTVQPGDTLSKIAETKLGSSKRWPEIASLNSLPDPNKIQVGQVLRLPNG